MPELPEVQTIVDDLNKKIIGRRIIGAWFDAPKIITLRKSQGYGKPSRIIKKPKPDELEKQIKGLKIAEIKRRGKNILIYLTKIHNLKPNAYLLLIHQKLTGHLLVGKWRIRKAQPSPAARGIRKRPPEYKVLSLIKGPLEEKVNNYIHLIFYLDNGWQIGLSDLRKFAKVLFGSKEEIESLSDLTKIGQEPLDKSLKVSKFKSLIKSRKGKIKQVLMNQEVIAGIGNIYSDEILWQAKIHPLKAADKLTDKEIKNIYSAMRQILEKAVKLRGTSISDFRDSAGKPGAYAEKRFVYQREAEACQRCQSLIKRIKIGGRSSHYCPKCQR